VAALPAFQRSLAALLLLSCSHQARAQQSPLLLLPSAIAYDAAGDLFFVDTNRNQAFEVSLAGVLTTIAGTGTQGFSGDSGSATNAELNAPQGIAVDPSGTIYIADTGNHRIRSITGGQIATIAGTGTPSFSGDGLAATTATLSTPTALAIDPQGNLLLCDTANHRIRRISAGIITTIAGTGVQGFSGDGLAATAAELDSPAGLATSPDGRIFLADSHNHRLRLVTTTGIIQTIAGIGTPGYSGDGLAATAAQLSLPRGITLDAAGNILFADSNNQRIRSINAQGIIQTIAGSGVQGIAPDDSAAASVSINTPRSVAVSSFNSPVFAESPNHLVREVAANGELYTIAVPSSPRSTTVSLTAPTSVVYGQVSATITVSGSAAAPQGAIHLLDGTTPLTSTTLSSGAVTIPLLSLTAGTHTLIAAYAGDGINPAATSAPTAIDISQAQSKVVLQPLAQSSYTGLPLVLTANLTSSTTGVPTGEVDFLNGSTVVAKATAINGLASATISSPPQGTLTLIATYLGDANFLGSSSPPFTTTVSTMPDFTLAATTPSQTLQGGLIASYPLTVSPAGGPFTGNVTFSVTGLQPTATASFSPPTVVPGANGTATTMNIQTAALARLAPYRPWNGYSALWCFTLPFAAFSAIKKRKAWQFLTLTLFLATTFGCGARTLSSASQQSQSYNLAITATSTNLAGAIVVHTASVTLTIQ
jgi:sugar lactone lactonase YvrE